MSTIDRRGHNSTKSAPHPWSSRGEQKTARHNVLSTADRSDFARCMQIVAEPAGSFQTRAKIWSLLLMSAKEDLPRFRSTRRPESSSPWREKLQMKDQVQGAANGKDASIL